MGNEIRMKLPHVKSVKLFVRNNYKILIGVLIGVLIATGGIAMATRDSRGLKKTDTETPTQTNSVKESNLDQSETDTQTVPQENNNPQSTNSNNNSKSAPPPSVTTQSVPPPATSCNTTLQQSYTNSYNSSVAYENTRHENEINRIASYWAARGLRYSSYYENDIANEDAIHQNNLVQLQTTFNRNLTSINCP